MKTAGQLAFLWYYCNYNAWCSFSTVTDISETRNKLQLWGDCREAETIVFDTVTRRRWKLRDSLASRLKIQRLHLDTVTWGGGKRSQFTPMSNNPSAQGRRLKSFVWGGHSFLAHHCIARKHGPKFSNHKLNTIRLWNRSIIIIVRLKNKFDSKAMWHTVLSTQLSAGHLY